MMHQPPMFFILVLLVGCALSGAIGFFLGYYLGRQSRDRQAGFPVLPVEEKTGHSIR